MLSFVQENPFDTTQQLIESIVEDVEHHVQQAEQSDDMTLLAINYKGAPLKYEKNLTLLNDISQISLLQSFIDEVGEEIGLEKSLVLKLNLALEEAVSNIILYAYPKEMGKKIMVSVTLKNNDLIFTITDTGIPFDPTLSENPNIDITAEERPIGGLGIFLIKQIMNEVTYTRIHDINVFTMKKKIDQK